MLDSRTSFRKVEVREIYKSVKYKFQVRYAAFDYETPQWGDSRDCAMKNRPDHSPYPLEAGTLAASGSVLRGRCLILMGGL